jgi:hypothetical protein
MMGLEPALVGRQAHDKCMIMIPIKTKSLRLEGFSFGVNDGARTHDLQNHNLAF